MGLRGIPANYGGFETFAEELAPRLVDRGHKVTVYGRSNNITYPAPFYKGVRLRILPTISHKYLDTIAHTFLCSLHALFFERFDVIIMVNAANAPFAGIARLGGAKVVLNLDGIERLRKKWNVWGRMFYRMGEWLATKLPHAQIADAESIRQYYAEHYQCPTHLIAYGANQKKEPAGQTLKNLNLQPKGYVLYVTRFEPENNPHRLISAFKKVKTDLKLVIVGDAPYANDYKALLKQLADEDDRVILPGAIYGLGYRELLSNALLYVQATEVGGTHPALIESMAVGNCIIANTVDEHVEVLSGSGLLYRKNDETHMAELIQQVINDPDLREKLSNSARKRIQTNYTWEVITDKYEQLIEATHQGTEQALLGDQARPSPEASPKTA